jgi:hypothetical protein
MKIDFDKIEFGEGHGTLYNFFKNIYFEKRYIGRTYNRAKGLDDIETTYIYFPGSIYLNEEQINILKSHGAFLDDTAECEEIYYPWTLKFENDEDKAINFFGEMIDKLSLNLDEFYPVSDRLI